MPNDGKATVSPSRVSCHVGFGSFAAGRAGDKSGNVRHGADSGITAIGFRGLIPGDFLQVVPTGKFNSDSVSTLRKQGIPPLHLVSRVRVMNLMPCAATEPDPERDAGRTAS
jgi:hypothetical protein